jgi:hypothetical protein
MSKLLAGVFAALIVGVGVAAASSLNSSNDPVRSGDTISTSDDTTGTTGTTTGTTTDDGTTTTTGTGADISGPCDEAEHANDSRCTGGPVAGRENADDENADDHRGRGRGRGGDDDRGDDHSGRGRGGDGGDEDRSGSNSGSDD